MRRTRLLALAGMVAGAVLALVIHRRTPAEIRRLEYRLTVFEELIAVLRDPLQLGILLGASAGALGAAARQAAERHARLYPRPSDGLVLRPPDEKQGVRTTTTQ